jgi:hypothetical protein
MSTMTELQPPRGAVARAVRAVAITLDTSAKARRTALALFAMFTYVLMGQALDPGFTHYWGYQLFQTGVTLAVVLTLDTVFAPEGGLAWQTHAIVVIATCVDIFGTDFNLYHRFYNYDKIVHFWSGVALAAGAYEVLRLLDRRGTIAVPPRRRMVLAWCIAWAIGGIAWETYEHLGDTVFNSGRVQGNWDTIHDLFWDAVGSLVAVVYLRAQEVVRTQPAGRPTAKTRS